MLRPGASSSAALTLVDLETHRGERVQAPEMEGALHVDILRARWQLSNVPPERRQLAAWPLQLPHCSLQLFRTHNDAEAVHAAAPRWHLKGDSECLMDMEVSVELLESGLQFLQSIAQIQKGLVCTRLLDALQSTIFGSVNLISCSICRDPGIVEAGAVLYG
jgi:hypothetical protein